MYFDEDSQKRIFEDLQFKRQVAFVDDESLPRIELRSFSKISEARDTESRECQVNIQNEIVSSSTQTRSKKSREVQTEFDDNTQLEPRNSDFQRIGRLLEKRMGLIEDAIDQNIFGSAFKNYDVDWSLGGTTITNPFTLTYKQLVKDEACQVTAIEWNRSGTTIFCAYGHFDHESVCTHKAAFCTWNIDRLKLDPNKPDVSIETNCCVSSISAHPENPAICAVGFFNGEIHVYDIRQSDPLVVSVTDKNEIHRDEVTSLKWIKDPKSAKKKFLLLSASKDGKLLTWNPLPSKNQLKLMEGFVMLTDDLTKEFGGDRIEANGSEMGVSSIAIDREDKEVFMVGCDSGGLFKCSFFAKDVISHKQWDQDFPVDLKSPVVFKMDRQSGPIYSISQSPFQPNLILTCGTDSEIKLYSQTQSGSLMNICPENGYLYTVEWSPYRPCVFACGTNRGNIIFYDLNESSSHSEFKQVIQASPDESPVYTLSFNQQRAELMASGDKSGLVKIWKLSKGLIRFDPEEEGKLRSVSLNTFKKKLKN